MLTALDDSVRAQRQLVADASHELRTPLASLRTNIEVLVGGKTLPEEEREKLLADVIGQVEELSTLVGDLVEIDRAQTPRGRGRPPRRARLGGDRPGARAHATGLVSRESLGVGRARLTLPARPRRLEPPRQRGEMERLGGRLGGGNGGDGARPRPRDRRSRISPTSSTASTARPTRATCRARASGSRSSARLRSRTAARRRRRTRLTAARSSTSAWPRALRFFSGRPDTISV